MDIWLRRRLRLLLHIINIIKYLRHHQRPSLSSVRVGSRNARYPGMTMPWEDDEDYNENSLSTKEDLDSTYTAIPCTLWLILRPLRPLVLFTYLFNTLITHSYEKTSGHSTLVAASDLPYTGAQGALAESHASSASFSASLPRSSLENIQSHSQ